MEDRPKKAGRPPKEGLDFAGWDVNIFDNEPKIDKLIDAQGCIGFVIYFYLCQKAYGSHGYFYEWSCDDAPTIARKIGGGVGSQAVIDTVRLCCRVGLFDNDLLEGHKILTSRGIQKRYRPVAISRAGNSVIQEYWLLEKEESIGLNFCTRNTNFAARNGNYDPSKLNYDPLQYTTVKNSTVQYNIPEEIRDEWDAYSQMREQMKKPLTEKAVEIALKKLYELAPDDTELQKSILNQSTFNCWKDLYELNKKGASSKTPADIGRDDDSEYVDLEQRILEKRLGGTKT